MMRLQEVDKDGNHALEKELKFETMFEENKMSEISSFYLSACKRFDVTFYIFQKHQRLLHH